MAGSLAARKRSTQCRTKMKTGCATCRIRKVKCDEKKPCCQKCIDTGRTCDGYESPFRVVTSRSIINGARASGIPGAASRPVRPALTEISPADIDLLNRYFSTKTMFDVKLGCDEEAREVSSGASRDLWGRFRICRPAEPELWLRLWRSTILYGLGGLASNLSSPGSNALKSALLCCQIFISIEQVRGNYGTMAQHIIQGLGIMHEYRARPTLDDANNLVPAHHAQLPLLDAFVIKLFAAPCKFAEPSATADKEGGKAVSMCAISRHEQTVGSRNLRTIVPDMRTELTRISTSTLDFLGKVSSVDSAGNALRLLPEKTALLESLKSWLMDLEVVHADIKSPGTEPLAVSFLRLFHQILKIILVEALNSSSNLQAELRAENDRLQGIGSIIDERVSAYRKRSGSEGGSREPAKVR
ncbi:hypothetical protein ACCO45_006271 [Purpureocillium lilacinum]|uniref:Uncharacterized protein n=1 Tax=Purpureocillium lilacinum TaxID=33203 RepID=A0ACC4E044_PURLI